MNKFTLPVLDHGFVTLRNLAGPTRRDNTLPDNSGPPYERTFDADDMDVANSARMSFDAADMDRTYEIEMKLNRYLLANRHMTPFESIEVWLEMKLPIFVARQFVRHRTTSLNEVSGRYVQLPEEWYIPPIGTVMFQSKDKKQGGKVIDLADPSQAKRAAEYIQRLDADCKQSWQSYQFAIEDGIAMEQARLHLHLNHYTHWLWKQDLRNLMHFLSLRAHPHAQREAQTYAYAIIKLLEPHLPGLMALYHELTP